MSRLWRALWIDLDYAEPHPARALVFVVGAAVVSLAVWVLLVLWLAALAAPVHP